MPGATAFIPTTEDLAEIDKIFPPPSRAGRERTTGGSINRFGQRANDVQTRVPLPGNPCHPVGGCRQPLGLHGVAAPRSDPHTRDELDMFEHRKVLKRRPAD